MKLHLHSTLLWSYSGSVARVTLQVLKRSLNEQGYNGWEECTGTLTVVLVEQQTVGTGILSVHVSGETADVCHGSKHAVAVES